MKNFVARAALALTLCLTFALPASRLARAAEGEPSAPLAIGSKVEDFKLPDASGREQSLELLKGAKGTVLIFVSTQCPVSNAYNERMRKLAEDYRAKGVNVVGVNANVSETAETIRSHASEHKLSFTILKDEGNKLADRLGASVTPEAFFLDASGKLVYRGRIDNSRNGDSITSQELRDAIEAVLAGKLVEKSEVRAFGCSIKRAGAAS
ncbi:MAG TPA: redoxin domain-containing protein [Pyrinomonadaceae bacterium]|nr:redoxin domain-containing protein [Pyrinomonadaceae bacterium]